MSLPNSRDKTYAASDHVNLSHLTNWQDFIRILWQGQHPSRTMLIHAYQCAEIGWSLDKDTNYGMRHTSGSSATMGIPIDLPSGTVVTLAEVAWNPDTVGASMVATLKSMDMSDGSISSHGTVTSNTTAYHNRTITPTAPGLLLASGSSYFLEVVSSDQDSIMAAARITYIRTGRTTPP